MSTHRREVRPRYGRILALAVSVTVSAVAALAGLGVLATSTASAGPAARPASYTQSTAGARDATGAQTGKGAQTGTETGSGTASRTDPTTPPAGGPGDHVANFSHPDSAADTTLPADSGSGRRIVFSQSRQRVWLMGQQPDAVQRTYLVSGSVTHNLQPGTYSVYSKSRWAVGVEDSGVMQYFVRFTQGPTGAAIGFHSIPTKDGVALQTKAQLGTPQSHGCIRQDMPDAIALWNFAPVGAKVVVVA
ncbi:MAG TPA: L,D-transpeptidase family protein [Nocardioides sp.]|uniref:L,D-transpeptidase n=1 Tax=Nocardioides sp. TaxID=35761 RepID=UPI002F4298C4